MWIRVGYIKSYPIPCLRPTATSMARTVSEAHASIVRDVQPWSLGALPGFELGCIGYIMDLIPQNSSLYRLIYGCVAAQNGY
jgi:hypothetical protein